MSEIKRVPLIPFSSSKVNDKKCKEASKTLRISVVLPQSNEDRYPEYNYKELLAAAKRKEKGKPPISPSAAPNGLDPFNDDDDEDVRRIAQEMEAKYGIATPKKKIKGRKDDYADIGMGYDESDSFIDNTDGYDEMIPQNVTTLHGGFYINCGALEFKTDDEASSGASSSESDAEDNKKARRKRILETSDESEEEKETEKSNHSEKKQKLQANGVSKVVKKKFLTPDKIKQLKRKQRAEDKRKSLTVKDLLREKREDLNMSVPMEVDENGEKESENKEPDAKDTKRQAPSFDKVSDVIESVVKGNTENKLEKKTEEPVKTTDIKIFPKSVDNIIISDGENSRDSTSNKGEVEIVKLPENLPADILEIIIKIKEAASNRSESKVKFFSGPVSEMLLSLERKCKCLGKQSRMKVYEHLAPFVKCRKETLIRRAKNLVLEDDQRRINSMLTKLKTAINSIMPGLLENYELESQKIMQRKFSKESLENEETKHLRLPKRRFMWTEEMKKLLKEVIALRRKCYILEGKNKDAIDNQLQMFLKTEVQVFWPEGWMSMNTLQKFVNSLSEVKKDSPNKAPPMLTSNGQAVSQPSNISIPASISKDLQLLPANSALSITPVLQTTSNNPMSSDSAVKSVTISDISVDRITTEEKVKKSLPVDYSKAPSSLTITPTNTAAINLSHDNHERTSPAAEARESYSAKQAANNKLQANYDKPQATYDKPQATYDKPQITFDKPQTIYEKGSYEKATYEKAAYEKTTYDKSQAIYEKVTFDKPQSTNNKPQTNSSKPQLTSSKPQLTNSKPQNINMKPLSTNSKQQSTNNKPQATNVKPQATINKPQASSIKPQASNNKPELIILDDKIKQSPIISSTSRTSNVQDNSAQSSADKKPSNKTDSNHCQIINLTDPTDMKRKPGPSKPKTKYIEDFEKVLKPTEIIDKTKLKPEVDRSKHKSHKDERASIAQPLFSQMFSDFSAQALKISTSSSNTSSKVTDHSIKKLSTPTNFSSISLDYSKPKASNEGDAIQKVMEDLKVLQKLSSPNKLNDPPSSSPVSVIAFNKSFSPKPTNSGSIPQGQSSGQSSSKSTPRSDFNKADFGPGFQEAFQRQLLNDFNMMKSTVTSSASSATSKSHYNSSDKYSHASGGTFPNEKYFQTSNNNFPLQNSSKLKSTLPTTPTGTYNNILDDMLSNFFTEYGYPKTANHKPKAPQK